MAAAAEVQGPRTPRGGEKPCERIRRRPELELKDLLKALNPGIQKLPLFSFVTQTPTSNPPLPQMILFKTISVSVNVPATTHPLVVNRSLKSLREQLKQQLLNHINTNPPTELEQIKSGGHVCFLGQAGSGKTTLLRVIARNSVTGRCGYGKIKYVHMIHPGPFEIESVKSECFAWQAIFSCNIGKPDVRFSDAESKTLFDHAAKYPQKFLLLFDSLDTLPKNLNEVEDPGNAYRPDIKYPSLVHLSMLLRGRLLKGCRIVTSSRPHATRNFAGDLLPPRMISLFGFSKNDALKALELYSADADKIFKIVESTPHLFSLFKEPVFLVYLVEIWPALRKEPEKMRATDILINLVGRFRESCHAKGNYQKLKEMQKLAHEILWRRKLEFDEVSLKNYGLKIEDLTDLCTNALDKSEKQINLRLTTGKSQFMFSHQSIQEMFAAVDLAESKMSKFENDIKIIHEPFFLKTRDFVYGLLFGRFGHDESEFPDMEKKCEVLKDSIESRFRDASLPEQLSIFETLAEAITGVRQFNLDQEDGINFSGNMMGDWSFYCIGVGTSQFSILQVLHLEGCGIQLSHLRALQAGICRFNCEQLQILSFSLSKNPDIGSGKTTEAIAIACDIVRTCKVRDFDMGACGLNSDSMSEMLYGLRDITIDALNLEVNAIGKKGIEIAGTIVKQCSVKDINISDCATTFEQAEAFGKSAKGSQIRRLSVQHRKQKIICGYGNAIRDCDVGTLVMLLTTLTPDDACRITKDSSYGKISRIEFAALVNNKFSQLPAPYPTTASNCQAIRILLPIVKKQICMPLGIASSLIENLQSSLDDLQCEGPVITFPTGNKVLTLKSEKRQSRAGTGTDGNTVQLQPMCKVEKFHEESDTPDAGRIRRLMESEYLKLSDGCRTISWLTKNKHRRKAVSEILNVYGLSLYQYKLEVDDCNLLAKFLSPEEPYLLKSLSFAEVTGLDLLLSALNGTSYSVCQATEVCFVGYSGTGNELSPNIIAGFVDKFQAESLVLMAIDTLCVPLKELRTALAAKAKTVTSFRKLEIYHNPDMGDEEWGSLADIARDRSTTPLHISMCFCDVTDDHLRTFQKNLGSTKLAGIDVCGNPQLSDKGFSILGEMIRTSQISSVSLEDCELDVKKIQSLNIACCTNSSSQIIKFLNLADNPSLGPEGFTEVKRTVECYKVESLNLSNSIPDNLPEEFNFEHKFESLDLSENRYCTNLANLAKSAKKKLYLRNCRLSVDELVTLALNLEKHGAKLEEVDVSDDSKEFDFDSESRLKDAFKSITSEQNDITLSSD